MHFDELKVSNWRQFESVSLDLSGQTTILTGTNGCGKTTLLNLLSKHFGWNLNVVSTPFTSKRYGRKLFSDFLRKKSSDLLEDSISINSQQVIGQIRYSNQVVNSILTPPNSSETPQYQVVFQQQQAVNGMHIPSHRPAAVYQAVTSIPTNPKTYQQHYQEFQTVMLQTYSATNSQKKPSMVLKESLISLAVFGPGNNAVESNDEYLKIFEKFQNILRQIMPETIGFQRIEIRMPDVVLITDSGDFSLDAMSGGINALLGIAWQILMCSMGTENTTIIIDEPENHLHPRMQRTLLPSLERAFPNTRFIIATHSPFIVTSNPRATVYGLTNSNGGGICSKLLSEIQLASSPDKILREVLDVPSTSPVWVENKVKSILAKYKHMEPTAQTAKSIYEELSEFGLTDSLSDFGLNSSEE
jgi:predicted ATPase